MNLHPKWHFRFSLNNCCGWTNLLEISHKQESMRLPGVLLKHHKTVRGWSQIVWWASSDNWSLKVTMYAKPSRMSNVPTADVGLVAEISSLSLDRRVEFLLRFGCIGPSNNISCSMLCCFVNLSFRWFSVLFIKNSRNCKVYRLVNCLFGQ